MIKQVHVRKLVMILMGGLLSVLFVNCNVAAQLETEFLNSTQGFSQVATVTSNGITTVLYLVKWELGTARYLIYFLSR